MACSQYYNYYPVFQEFGSRLREIILYSVDRPYPVYETYSEYQNDASSFKGILVWESYKYYKDAEEGGTAFSSDVGFYIIPEFGQVNVIPNYEYRQTIAITFDSNCEPDFDPYQKKIIIYIDWLINKIHNEVERLNEGYILSTGAVMYCNIQGISNPIYATSNSSYVRRVLTLVCRMCQCY